MITHHIAYLVCNNTGETFKILDVKAFVKDIVDNRSEWYADNYFFTEFRLEDCHGKSLGYIAEEAIAKKRKTRSARLLFRFGGYKRRSGSCCRHPKTTAELRSIAGLEADGYEYLVRSRRKRIPTYYDDLWSPSFTNWKSFRKKQYK